MFDLAPNPMDEFKSNVLGITLKRYTVNNTNPSEHLFNKIQSFTDIVQEIKSGNLFENGREANSTDFVLHLYSDIADTKKDIPLLLRIADAMQAIEKGTMKAEDITDPNIKQYINKYKFDLNPQNTESNFMFFCF